MSRTTNEKPEIEEDIAIEENIAGVIRTCESYIERHQKKAKTILRFINFVFVFIAYIMVLFIALSLFDIFSSNISSTFAESTDLEDVVPYPVLVAALSLVTIVFGVLMSIYRFHLKEISKLEHYIIGFFRISIVANDSSIKGFENAQQVLLEKAFTFEPAFSDIVKRRKKVESPLPGHPVSDFSATVFDKLFEKYDFVKRKKRDKEELE